MNASAPYDRVPGKRRFIYCLLLFLKSYTMQEMGRIELPSFLHSLVSPYNKGL